MGKNYNILEEEQVPQDKKDSTDEEPPAYNVSTPPVLQDDFTRNEFLAADLNLDHNFSDTRIILDGERLEELMPPKIKFFCCLPTSSKTLCKTLLYMELVFIIIKLNTVARYDEENESLRRISFFECLPEILALITAFLGLKNNYEIYLCKSFNQFYLI